MEVQPWKTLLANFRSELTVKYAKTAKGFLATHNLSLRRLQPSKHTNHVRFLSKHTEGIVQGHNDPS